MSLDSIEWRLRKSGYSVESISRKSRNKVLLLVSPTNVKYQVFTDYGCINIAYSHNDTAVEFASFIDYADAVLFLNQIKKRNGKSMNTDKEKHFLEQQTKVYERIKGFANGGTLTCESSVCNCAKRCLISATNFSTVVTPNYDIELVCLHGAKRFAALNHIVI